MTSVSNLLTNVLTCRFFIIFFRFPEDLATLQILVESVLFVQIASIIEAIGVTWLVSHDCGCGHPCWSHE